MTVIKGVFLVVPAVLLTAVAVIGVGAALSLSSWEVL